MRFFRINCEHHEKDKVLSLLSEEGFSCRQVSGSDSVMAATHEPFPMGGSLAHYFGYIYIQDISSTLPVMLLDPPAGSIVLDMCASPGSKTSQLSRAVGPGGLVVANEPNPSRLATLRTNLRRLNLVNVISSGYIGQDPAFSGLSFDRILLDVPCSGWGTLNKNPGAARVWAGDKLNPLVALQKVLLETASRLLSPGGRLVYSTCTTNVLENEEQVEWATKNLALTKSDPGPFLPEPSEFPGIELTGPGMMRVKGSNMGGQDFFMAALTTPPERTPEAGVSGRPPRKPRQGLLAFDDDMRQLEHGSLWDFSGNVFFVQDKAWDLLSTGFSAQGIRVGKKRGNKFIISPRMRVFLPEGGAETGFNTTSLEQVRSLVSGQSLNFSFSGSRCGFYWNDLGLGWLKVSSKRILWSDR